MNRNRRNALHTARAQQRNALALTFRAGETNRLRAGAFDYLINNGMQPANANALAAILDYVPVVGDVSGAEDTYQAARAGDYGTAGLMAAATALGVVPLVGDAAAAGVKKGIRAFHGSPHAFDRFDLSKIGTGEGAQAYGHGLYFAESEGVARSYRDALSANQPYRVKLDGQEVGARSGDNWMMDVQQEIARKTGGAPDGVPDFIYEGIIGRVTRARISGDEIDRAKLLRQFDHPSLTAEQRKAVAVAADKSIAATQNVKLVRPGSMYEVNINANPDEFLDWDRPLIEQPKTAQDAMRRTLAQTYGEDFFDEYAAQGTGMKDALDNFDDIPAERWASELGKQGIPGIRYLDAGSRTAGDGSRNYVVFDDSLVEILRKYGLGAVMVGGAYALTQQEYEQAEQLL